MSQSGAHQSATCQKGVKSCQKGVLPKLSRDGGVYPRASIPKRGTLSHPTLDHSRSPAIHSLEQKIYIPFCSAVKFSLTVPSRWENFEAFDKKGYTSQNLDKKGDRAFRRRRSRSSPSNRLQIKIYSVCHAPWAPPNHPEFFSFFFSSV